MAHGEAREEKWRGNWRMEWVTSKSHMTAEHRLARKVQTLQADVHSSPASSLLNWRPRRFKWTRPFCRKTKSGFCTCAITFQTQSTPWGLKMQALRSFARLKRTNTVIRHSTEHTSPRQHHHCGKLKSRVMLSLTFQRFAKSTLMLSVVENLKNKQLRWLQWDKVQTKFCTNPLCQNLLTKINTVTVKKWCQKPVNRHTTARAETCS
jgi:hypothetical protein